MDVIHQPAHPGRKGIRLWLPVTNRPLPAIIDLKQITFFKYLLTATEILAHRLFTDVLIPVVPGTVAEDHRRLKRRKVQLLMPEIINICFGSFRKQKIQERMFSRFTLWRIVLGNQNAVCFIVIANDSVAVFFIQRSNKKNTSICFLNITERFASELSTLRIALHKGIIPIGRKGILSLKKLRNLSDPVLLRTGTG